MHDLHLNQISIEKLAKKALSGESLTAQEKLMIVSRRPMLSRKEWWALAVVWMLQGTLDPRKAVDKAVGTKSLFFLKRHLSAPAFDCLTRSLRENPAEAVTMRDVGRMLDHGSRLRELQKQVAKEQADAAAIAQQRAICK